MTFPRTTLLAIAAVTASLLAGTALGAGGPGGKFNGSNAGVQQTRGDQRFASADSNKDGSLSKAETTQGMPGLAAQFDALDSDHNGQLSSAEFQAKRATMRTSMSGKMGSNMRGSRRGGGQGPCMTPTPAQTL